MGWNVSNCLDSNNNNRNGNNDMDMGIIAPNLIKTSIIDSNKDLSNHNVSTYNKY